MYTKWFLNVFFLISLVMFSGCGGASGEEERSTNTNTPVVPIVDDGATSSTSDGTSECVNSYFINEVNPHIQACKSCHIPNAVAANTNLLFSDNDSSNQVILLSYMLANQNRIIQKNTGVLEHQGGANLSADGVLALTNFKSYSTNIPLCKLPDNQILPTLSASNVIQMSYPQTLNKLINTIYDRDATKTELLTVTSKGTLNTYLDTVMKDEKFYDWLMFKFNDVFQIDRFLGGNAGVAYFPTEKYNWFYPIRNTDQKKWRYIQTAINYGHVRQSLELIAHVVREERSFDEILTADYILVNPFTAISWDLENSEFYNQDEFSGFMYDHSSNYQDFSMHDFKEVKIHIHGRAKNRIPNIDYYPHAGILTDLMFLWKYPTTGTNRNRHRATKLSKFFLDLDIEEIAIRSSGDTGADNNFTNATTQNPNCTVCHYVMDPIAGAYHNFNFTFGSLFYIPRPKGWFDINEKDMFPIGYSMIEPMPDAFRDNSVQWLAKKLVKDPRFPRTMFKHFYKALTAKDLLSHPKASDTNYNELLQAFKLQESIVNDILISFETSNRNAKVLIKEIVFSPLFRSTGINTDVHSIEIDTLMDDAKLIIPERISNKLDDKMQTVRPSIYTTASQWAYFLNTYKFLYGGIDNNLNNLRNYEMDGIKASIQKRLAFDAGCTPLAYDMFYPAGLYSKKVLTPYVDLNTTPESLENIAKIKQNIQYLHKYLRNEDISLSSQELDITYTLLLETYKDFKTQGVTRMPYCGASHSVDGVYTSKSQDPTFMVRTWSVIINYMIDDFYFFFDVDKGDN